MNKTILPKKIKSLVKRGLIKDSDFKELISEFVRLQIAGLGDSVLTLKIEEIEFGFYEASFDLWRSKRYLKFKIEEDTLLLEWIKDCWQEVDVYSRLERYFWMALLVESEGEST